MFFLPRAPNNDVYDRSWGSHLSSWTLLIPTKAATVTGPRRTLLSTSHTGTSQEAGTGPQASWAAASGMDS